MNSKRLNHLLDVKIGLTQALRDTNDAADKIWHMLNELEKSIEYERQISRTSTKPAREADSRSESQRVCPDSK